jgi:hypothetical protein
MNWIEVNGRSLRYELSGRGRPGLVSQAFHGFLAALGY